MQELNEILKSECEFINAQETTDDRRDAFIRVFNEVLRKLDLLNYYLSESESVREYYIKDNIILVFKRDINGIVSYNFFKL